MSIESSGGLYLPPHGLLTERVTGLSKNLDYSIS